MASCWDADVKTKNSKKCTAAGCWLLNVIALLIIGSNGEKSIFLKNGALFCFAIFASALSRIDVNKY